MKSRRLARFKEFEFWNIQIWNLEIQNLEDSTRKRILIKIPQLSFRSTEMKILTFQFLKFWIELKLQTVPYSPLLLLTHQKHSSSRKTKINCFALIYYDSYSWLKITFYCELYCGYFRRSQRLLKIDLFSPGIAISSESCIIWAINYGAHEDHLRVNACEGFRRIRYSCDTNRVCSQIIGFYDFENQ